MELNDEQLETLLHRAHAGQYVNSVTHDLNNVLGAIMAYAELIQMDATDPEVQRMTGEIVSASEKGSALLDALTTIARPLVVDETETCSVSSVFEATELLFTYDIKRLGVDSVYTIADTVGRVAMSEHVLERILTRILDNAMDAIQDSQTRELFVEATRAGETVSIAIRTTGGEVEQPVVDRMFEPGFTTKEGHFGMGLTQAKALADRSNATLFYSPGPGFVLTVPVAVDDSD